MMSQQQTHDKTFRDKVEEKIPMLNEEIFAGKWNQLRGAVQQKWGELTDDDLDRVEGSARRMMGVLQERYGYTKERAEQELEKFMKSNQVAK